MADERDAPSVPALVAMDPPAADPGLLRRGAGPAGAFCAQRGLGRRVRLAARPAAPGPAGGDRLRAGQPPPVQLLRPDRAALHRPRTGHAQGHGGQLHQLRLQPEPGLAGGRHRLPLPAVLAAGAGQRRDHPHPVDEHADQLAGLHVAGRLPVPRASPAAAAQLEARQRWPAMAGRRPGAGGGGVLRGLPALGRPGLDGARARALPAPMAHGRRCSWPSRASTGA